MSVTVHPLTPRRWAQLVTLFGPRGACGGCWCMWPRLSAADFRRGRGVTNRRAFRRVVEKGPPPGVLLYVDGQPAGWCAVGPRKDFPRLDRSRVLARLDAAPVWSVVCFFVARAHRGRGLGVRLLRAAVDLAARHGARLVEGYPVDPRGQRAADVFVWTGLPSLFQRAGFREAARRSPGRPIMRRRLRARRRARGRRSPASAGARSGRATRSR